jgi:hypothetical protein
MLVIANDRIRGVTQAFWVLVIANDPRYLILQEDSSRRRAGSRA